MIRTLTDSARGELGYGGPPVAIRCGIDVADVRKDMHCPSAVALAYYRQSNHPPHERDGFMTDSAWLAFVQEIITKPSGTALDGRLTWETP